MGRVRIIIASGLAAIGLAAISAIAPAAARGPQDFARELLAAHNDARAAKGLDRLAWDGEMARDAHRWAQLLARSGRLEHASNAERGGAGENLWAGTSGRHSASEMIDAFVEERRDFTPGTFPEVSRTGKWKDVGHYTQIIWPETQKVGCAIARGEHWDFLVCRYWPAGNIVGRKVG
jgi:hypothetical protein